MATDWKFESARATFFFGGMDAPKWDTIWPLVVKAEPEKVESRPAQRTESVSLSSSETNRVCALAVQPGRIDWNLTVINPDDPQAAEDAISSFARETVEGMAKGSIHFSRLALGAVVLWPVPTVEEARAKLRSMVPSLSLKDTDEFSDLFLQINWPHESRVMKSVKINRLMKWSMARVNRLRIDASTPDIAPHHSTEHFCRLELDINTTPESAGPFDGDSATRLFREFVEDANTTMARGERT